MGTGESGPPIKAAKLLPTQDQLSTPTSYSEWAAAFQAYYNSGGPPPPGYFPPSVVSGPQPHPYMWGGQPIMPPYGTPPPFGAVYPHSGMYAHPSISPGVHQYGQFGIPSAGEPSEATTMTHASGDLDGMRDSDMGKDASPSKTPKGRLGSVGIRTRMGEDSGKGNSGSANGAYSQSGESGSDGSSEGSEEDNAQNILPKRCFEQTTSDGSGVSLGQALSGRQLIMSGKTTSICAPTTNLGMGNQDYWSGSNPEPGPERKGLKRTSACSSSGLASASRPIPLLGAGGRDAGLPELWLQDEREVKRQRRKQSNRESARRSRLRKQAECEELGTRVDTLTMENMALRTELARLSEDCKKLTSDHSSLLEKLQKYRVEDTMAVDKHQSLDMQPEGNGKVDDGCNISCPKKHGKIREEETSHDSPERFPSALDDRPNPETLGAG